MLNFLSTLKSYFRSFAAIFGVFLVLACNANANHNFVYADVNGDGITDRITADNGGTLNYYVGSWYTANPSYHYFQPNGYWGLYSIILGGVTFNDSAFPWVYGGAAFWNGYATSFNLEFVAYLEAGYNYDIFEINNTSNPSSWNPANWTRAIGSAPFSTSSDGISFFSKLINNPSTLQSKSYAMVRYGKPISKSSLTSSGGFNYFPQGAQNNELISISNLGGGTLEVSALDSLGKPIVGDTDMQFLVENLASDADGTWTTSDKVTLSGLSLGDSISVQIRRAGKPNDIVQLAIVIPGVLDVINGQGGYNARSEAQVSSYPYGNKHQGSCGIAAVRNVLHMKGKPVPTSQTLTDRLNVLHGVPISQFEVGGAGTPPNKVTPWLGDLLEDYGLTLEQRTPISIGQLKTELKQGKVFLLGRGSQKSVDSSGNPITKPGHIVAIRYNSSTNRYEIANIDVTNKWKRKESQINKSIGLVLETTGGSSDSSVSYQVWEVKDAP